MHSGLYIYMTDLEVNRFLPSAYIGSKRQTFLPKRGRAGLLFYEAAPERGEAVKQPMEADFDVQVREGHVEVIFRPTESHISFGILVDPKDIARLGRLSRSANVRHAKTGDTGDYSASEVEAVAFRLASAAISDR